MAEMLHDAIILETNGKTSIVGIFFTTKKGWVLYLVQFQNNLLPINSWEKAELLIGYVRILN
jgi:hypothetical protein